MPNNDPAISQEKDETYDDSLFVTSMLASSIITTASVAANNYMRNEANSKIDSLNEVTGIIDGQLDAEKFKAYQQYRENIINDVDHQRYMANNVLYIGTIASVTFAASALFAMIRAKSKAKASKAKTPTTEPADQ